MKIFLLLIGTATLASIASAADTLGGGLIEAVRRGQTSSWQAQLEQKVDVHAVDRNGNTALHHAALNRDVAAVRGLLAAGADVNAKNAAAATPLLYGTSDVRVVRTLLAGGADAKALSKQKYGPLFAAAMHARSFEVVQLLLAAGADPAATRNSAFDGVLERAASGGDKRTLEFLLARKPTKASLDSALGTAIGEGDIALVRQLLDLGADPNYNNSFTGHALNGALFSGQLEIARLLLQRDAKVDVVSPWGPGTPTIMFAAYDQTGDDSIARALVAAGANVNQADRNNQTALSYALRTGARTPLTEYLRSIGATAPESARSRQVPDRPVPASPAQRVALISERMPATLEILRRSSMAFLDNAFVQEQKCTSCHGQDLPAVAFDLARARGFAIDDVAVGRQVDRQMERWSTRAEFARQMMRPIPGTPVTLSYGLFGLKAIGYPADDTTDAMARFLLRTQKEDGRWTDVTRRPPMEDGEIVATAWAALSVRDYAPEGEPAAKTDSLARSATWLAQQKPTTHNETVFQILGLHWAGASVDRTSAMRDRLTAQQRPDGGWAQLEGLESDAWATGIALYSLHEAGRLKTRDPIYQRGLAFLLRTQFEDGSWWVRNRTWAFQPHFDGQFPHGKDQWISQAATAWAAIALLFAVEPVSPAIAQPRTADLVAAYMKSATEAGSRTAAAQAATAAVENAHRVDFSRDLQPLFERSCSGCHGGDKPRAGFSVATTAGLLKGGASGEKAILPGDADGSPLIRYVTGKIEDLEMPPLDRREKYPPLAVQEIDLLRAWINAGAP